jgi:hypothetical protein
MTAEFERRMRNAQNGTEAGLFAVALALTSVATQLKWLGNGDAATHMGALEALGEHIGEKIDRLARSLDDIAERIGETP